MDAALSLKQNTGRMLGLSSAAVKPDYKHRGFSIIRSWRSLLFLFVSLTLTQSFTSASLLLSLHSPFYLFPCLSFAHLYNFLPVPLHLLSPSRLSPCLILTPSLQTTAPSWALSPSSPRTVGFPPWVSGTVPLWHGHRLALTQAQYYVAEKMAGCWLLANGSRGRSREHSRGMRAHRIQEEEKQREGGSGRWGREREEREGEECHDENEGAEMGRALHEEQ